MLRKNHKKIEIQSKIQEKIDKYNIYNGKQFDIYDIVRMLQTYNLNIYQRRILNKQLIKLYCQYYNINVNYNITPQFQRNCRKETVAMWLTQQNLLIPKQWMHNYDIKNFDYKTLKDLMMEYNIPIMPQCWDENNMNIFDKAYFGIIPDIKGYQPHEQNNQGYTVAMLLALNNIDIPKE